jgi:hypothetical protein
MEKLFNDIKPFFKQNQKDTNINKQKKIEIKNPINIDSYLISNKYIPIINKYFINKEIITYNNNHNKSIYNY